MLYNFVAHSLDTVLNENALILADELEAKILQLPEDSVLYHCFYDVEKRPSLVGYSGVLSPVFDTIHIDMDGKNGVDKETFQQTISLAKFFDSKGVDCHVYFSGNKGFHIAVHMTAFGISAGQSNEVQAKVKTVLAYLSNKYPHVDTAIFNSNRKFRAFRSKNEKTGLYKIRLTGIGFDWTNISLDKVKEMAKEQQDIEYVHPAPAVAIAEFLSIQQDRSTPIFSSSTVKIKEISEGKMMEDGSLKFSNFADKKCIKDMLKRTLPQFNRHDIGMRIMADLKNTGKTVDEATQIIDQWASGVFEPKDFDRKSDTIRMLRGLYDGDQYNYGCYDDVRKAYCSAKCKIYNVIDPMYRAEPLSCTLGQKKANEIRRNPDIELSEGEIADRIIREMPQLITKNGDFFQWIGTHWTMLDRDRFQASIKTAAIDAYDNQAPSKKIASLVVQIISKINVAPEHNNLYSVSPDKFNFTDGTFTVIKDKSGSVKLNASMHNKEDFISYCAPFPLISEHGLPRSGDFLKYVETRRSILGEDGLRSFSQMFGAALIPYSPRIFFMLGESNSGKSTAAVVIEKLLGAQNISSVDPTTEYTFAWESAIGKIANIKKELTHKRPLQDDLLKEIRDKTPVDIQRKGQRAVRATLPFLHIYCCNKMPPSFEGNTGALGHRITMLKFKKLDDTMFSHMDNLGQWLWETDAGTILDYARAGLQDLIVAGFKYSSSDESKKDVADWQDETDSVKSFYQDATEKELIIYADTVFNEGIKGSDIYDTYVHWARKNGYRQFASKKFYKELERCGVERCKRTKYGTTFNWDNITIKPIVDKPNTMH